MKRGFTLIELLVVISIITLLAGIVSVAVVRARRHAAAKAVQHEIRELSLAIESYQGDFGDYPPSSLAELGLTKTTSNEINEGNEALVAALATRRRNGPYFPFTEQGKEENIANLDDDRASPPEEGRAINWIFGDGALREYTDYWGNPYVYFHNRDYGKTARYVDRDGATFAAKPGKSEKTATYHSVLSFQLWSLGPNGINENGEGDDIPSW